MPENFTKDSSLNMEPSAEGNLISNDDGARQGDMSIQVKISHLDIRPKGATAMEMEEVKLPTFKMKHRTHNYANDL